VDGVAVFEAVGVCDGVGVGVCDGGGGKKLKSFGEPKPETKSYPIAGI
jgi:hypothetical protein